MGEDGSQLYEEGSIMGAVQIHPLNWKTGEKIIISSKLDKHVFGSRISPSPDGSQLVDSNMNIYATKNFELIDKLDTEEYTMNCISYSRDGQFLAAGGDDGLIRIWTYKSNVLPSK